MSREGTGALALLRSMVSASVGGIYIEIKVADPKRCSRCQHELRRRLHSWCSSSCHVSKSGAATTTLSFAGLHWLLVGCGRRARLLAAATTPFDCAAAAFALALGPILLNHVLKTHREVRHLA